MNQSPPEAWYMTHQGERIGPVTFSTLRERARDGLLNPRLDMVWSPGMPEWKLAGEIKDLFERRNPVCEPPEIPETRAPQAEAYVSPREESVEEQMSKDCDWPGAGRRAFILATLVFPVAWNTLLPVAGSLLAEPLGTEITTVILIAAAFLPAVVAIYVGIMRLANLGMSRWWIFGFLVPLLNFWVGYRCVACPPGYAYHRKLDATGLWLAILYWLLVVLVIIAILSFIALLLGAVGDPQIQHQLQDALQQLRDAFEPLMDRFIKKP